MVRDRPATGNFNKSLFSTKLQLLFMPSVSVCPFNWHFLHSFSFILHFSSNFICSTFFRWNGWSWLRTQPKLNTCIWLIFETQINRHKHLVAILNPLPSLVPNDQWFTQSVLLALFFFFLFFFFLTRNNN